MSHQQRAAADLAVLAGFQGGPEAPRQVSVMVLVAPALERLTAPLSPLRHAAGGPQPGKKTDTRARSFVERHGELVQVELDALPPEVLRELYEDAVGQFWDVSAFEEVVSQE